MSSAILRRARAYLPSLVVLAAALSAACGAPVRIKLPTGTGVPFPDFASAYTQATTGCAGVKTMSASLTLSGRAGSTTLSARIDAGFAAPDRLRLEGYPRVRFGGKPFFVLAANGAAATLVLTRDNRVLRDAAPSAIVEALAGIALDPGELRLLVSGCALAVDAPTSGRSYENGWLAVDTAGTTTFLRQQDGRWRIVAARRGSLTIEYSDFTGERPAAVHLFTAGDAEHGSADLTVRTSEVDVDVPLEDAVFSVDVPPTAAPVTLEELRQSLRGQGTEETEREATKIAETEVTEGTEPDQHGGAGARRGDQSPAGRVNRGWSLGHKQHVSSALLVLPGSTLDSPRAARRDWPSPPCPRASVLIRSRYLRPLRPRDLRPLRRSLV